MKICNMKTLAITCLIEICFSPGPAIVGNNEFYQPATENETKESLYYDFLLKNFFENIF